MSDLSNERFQSLLLSLDRDEHGIGTLGEKDLHALLKDFLAPRSAQEIPLGPFVADILEGKTVIEVQTGSYAPLRKKLASFLAHYEVTIATPLFTTRRIAWLDPADHVSTLRTSPVHESLFTVFDRLYEIRPFLSDPHLHFLFLLLSGVTVKEQDDMRGKARHGHKLMTEPVALEGVVSIHSLADYKPLMPPLSPGFTARAFAKETHVSLATARIALLMLHEAGLVRRDTSEKTYRYTLEEN